MLDVPDRVGRVVEELVVGFIEHGDDVRRQLAQEVVERLIGHARAGRVVGRGEEDEARLRRDGAQHRGQIGREVDIVDHDGADAEELRHQRVDGEGVPRGDDLVDAGPGEGVEKQLDDLVGAVAEHDVLLAEAEFLRDGVAQVEAAAIGVEVGALDLLVHRGHGERGGPERVFVGGELDDGGGVEAELARDVIDRLARLVRDEVEQFAVGYVLDRNHSLR